MKVNIRSVFNGIAYNKKLCRHASAQAAVYNNDIPSQQLKSVKDIPGPSSLPFIGQLLHFLPGGDLSKSVGNELYRKLNATYGPIVKLDSIFGSPTVVTVFDPDTVAYLLRAENKIPSRPGFPTLAYYRQKYKKRPDQQLRPTGLITDEGEMWKEFRSKVNPVMLQPKTIKLYNNAIDEVALDMVERIKLIRNDKNMITEKFDIEMNLWALESIGVVALGRRLNCLSQDLAEDSLERQLIKCVHDLFIISEQLDWQPSLWRYYSTRKFKKAMKIYEKQESLAKHFIAKAREAIVQTEQSSETKEKSVLEKLIEMDEELAIIMACDMLFAGVDTAANTMCATLYHLASNPEKQAKLREELASDQEKKPYLKACIKESMRLVPVVGGNIRMLTKPYNILGYHLPEGLCITFPHGYLSMKEENFPRPNEFIPERWLADKDDPLYYGNAHPFAFSPFGFGVRSCIGRRIADLEIETFLKRIIQNFQLDWDGPPPEIKARSLNYFVGPFNYVFKDV